MRVLLLSMSALSLMACGGSIAASQSVTTEAAVDPGTLPPPAPPATEGTIDRAALDEVLDGGLGRFLQRVETEPHLDAGRFVGFRVTALNGPIFEGVDLAPGDTLTSVNGMPIERPEQALGAWDALRVASELTVEYVREGEARQLRFAIE